MNLELTKCKPNLMTLKTTTKFHSEEKIHLRVLNTHHKDSLNIHHLTKKLLSRWIDRQQFIKTRLKISDQS